MKLAPFALAFFIAAIAATSGTAARADIPPTGKRECSGLEAGAACEVEGQSGQCVDTRCYSARPPCRGPDCPPGDGSYECRLCKPLPPAPAAAKPASGGCGCEGGGTGSAALALGIVGLALRHHRRPRS